LGPGWIWNADFGLELYGKLICFLIVEMDLYIGLPMAYQEIRSLQIKVSEYDRLIKDAQEPDLKAAYSTIQSATQVKLNDLQTKIVYTISTLVGNPVPK